MALGSSMAVQVENFPPGCPEMEIRQYMMGRQPVIVIEPLVEDETLILHVTASSFSEDMQELANAISSFAELIQEAAGKENNGTVSGG